MASAPRAATGVPGTNAPAPYRHHQGPLSSRCRPRHSTRRVHTSSHARPRSCPAGRAGQAQARRRTSALPAHPARQVDVALPGDELEDAAVRGASCGGVLYLEQHRILDVQGGCRRGRARPGQGQAGAGGSGPGAPTKRATHEKRELGDARFIGSPAGEGSCGTHSFRATRLGGRRRPSRPTLAAWGRVPSVPMHAQRDLRMTTPRKARSPSLFRAEGGRITLSPYSADCLSMNASGKALYVA